MNRPTRTPRNGIEENLHRATMKRLLPLFGSRENSPVFVELLKYFRLLDTSHSQKVRRATNNDRHGPHIPPFGLRGGRASTVECLCCRSRDTLFVTMVARAEEVARRRNKQQTLLSSLTSFVLEELKRKRTGSRCFFYFSSLHGSFVNSARAPVCGSHTHGRNATVYSPLMTIYP